MLDEVLTPQERAVVARAKAFAEEHVAPNAARWEWERLYPLETIKAALRDVAGGSAEIDLKVDPEIIGGLVVQIGSKMVDSSLRTKLNGIRTAMKEVG